MKGRAMGNLRTFEIEPTPKPIDWARIFVACITPAMRAYAYLECGAQMEAMAELREMKASAERELAGCVDLRNPEQLLPGYGFHRFVNGICACGQKPTNDPVKCPVFAPKGK